MIRNGASDDVEVDADAFTGSGGFDESAQAADDSALASDDFADVFLVDFELVDRRIAILDLVDFDGVGLVDQCAGDVLDQALQVWLKLFELVLELLVRFSIPRRGWNVVLSHTVSGGGQNALLLEQALDAFGRLGTA
jgi:hypothetical protein